MAGLNEPGAVEELVTEEFASIPETIRSQLRRLQYAGAIGELLVMFARELFWYAYLRGLRRGLEERAK